MANINKNIIMQAGAAVANATNKAAGLSASTPEPGAIISAIQLVNGGRTIGPDALAHFTESVRNKLLSLFVSMEPIQDFNGYGHPWPAGGGVNKLPNAAEETQTKVGVTVKSLGDGQYTINGTVIYDSIPYFTFDLVQQFTAANTQKLVIGGNWIGTISFLASGGARIDYWSKGDSRDRVITSIGNLVGNSVAKIRIELAANSVHNNETAFFMLIDSSVTDTSFSPYSNICPISGRTGLNVYAGPTSAIGDATTYSMDWTSPAGTVYAGSADIVSGDIKVAPYYASYNGETLVGPWVSSMDVYDPEGTPTTGAQVVDLGGTMTEYHITGQDIITLVGDNYIWSDSGDVTITE